jgi:A/G-specific adenine glycosylase
MMLAHRSGHILLEQRPATGIWGGLWSLPEFSADVSNTDFCASLGLQVTKFEKLPAFLHVFTHYRLTIAPVIARTTEPRSPAPEQSFSSPTLHWTKISALHSKGLPAPIRKLLLGLISDNVLR